jgi:hypothetical protein
MGDGKITRRKSANKNRTVAQSLAYKRENALNAICPYFTMFPLEYPLRVLRAHKKDSSVVMDPFCGRGTTLFASRKLGLVARGLDSSPIAVAIAKAKLAKINIDAVLSLAQTLLDTYAKAQTPKSDFFQQAYAPTVLKTMCAIREGLLTIKQDTDASVILRAAMLGCLHGPLNKDPKRCSYFSNQMPRTYASKPNYSVRYWREKGLTAPQVDILEVLRRKLERLEEDQLPDVGAIADVRYGDSRLASSIPISCRDFSVVVTSPPYYGMRTYVQDQWLRNWFLGGPDHVDYCNDFQLTHSGTAAFVKSLALVWKNMARSRAECVDMYIRFGIIPSSKVDAKALLRMSLEESGVGWVEVSVRPAKTASSGKRQANHMTAESLAAVEYDFHVRRVQGVLNA